jgi:hypothetical protein
MISPMSDIKQVAVSNLAKLAQGNYVSDILPIGNLLYVCGTFNTIGGIAANNIAVYDTQKNTWSPLGSGMNGSVNSMIMDSSNRLYACGMFTSAGGAPCSKIAMWDGSKWNALKSGLQGQGGPTSIAFYNSRLVVAGYFESADNVSGTRAIAMWDGSSWSSVSGGIQTNGVDILVAGSDGLYVGGQFYSQPTVDGKNATAFVKWDGNGWRWMGAFNDGVTSILVRSPTEIYVGGRFTLINGETINRIAQWDGIKWNAFGNGVNDVVNVIYMDPKYLYIAGQFNDRFSRWDGKEWTPLGLSFAGQWDSIQTVAFFENLVYIGGYFMTINNVSSPFFAKIDYLTSSTGDMSTLMFI